MKRTGLRACVLVLGLALFSAAAQAPPDVRIALVIGNAAYPEPDTLANPGRDAQAMAQALKSLGFTVLSVQDASRDQMAAAIAQAQAALKGRRGIGMLYYAGHGVQYAWRNYMVPVDARLQAETDIPVATVGVAAVLDAFHDAGNRLNLVVLDACRDNPFDNQLATKGLAPVDAPPGTFMAFATAAGNVASDGESDTGNGLYTQVLLQELGKPDARLDDVFTRVKLQVQRKSAGRQVPSESSNLDEDFSFDRGFASIDATRRAARLEHFAAEKAAWDRVKGSQSAADFFDFLQRYPNGFVSEIARFRVNQLQPPAVLAQARQDGVATLKSGVNRYAVGDEFTLVLTDLRTQLVRREPQKVTFASDERVEINGGATVVDQMGGLLRDDSGDKDPPVLLVPSDIALGKRWRSVFQNRVDRFDLRAVVDFKAVALEDITVQGQAFKAFRVTMEGWAGPVALAGTLWIDPATMRMVRWDRTVRAPGLQDATRIEVAGYRSAQ